MPIGTTTALATLAIGLAGAQTFKAIKSGTRKSAAAPAPEAAPAAPDFKAETQAAETEARLARTRRKTRAATSGNMGGTLLTRGGSGSATQDTGVPTRNTLLGL